MPFSSPLSGGCELLQQFGAEIVIIDLKRVAWSAIEAPVWRTELVEDTRVDIHWPLQLSRDLQSGYPRLIVCKAPNTADRLEQSHEKQIGYTSMHHSQQKRRLFARLPINNTGIEKRKSITVAGRPDDGVEGFRATVIKSNLGPIKPFDAGPRQTPFRRAAR